MLRVICYTEYVRFHFTKHANTKLILVKQAGFNITKTKVKQTIFHPLRTEERNDGTFITTTLLDQDHVLRVVYRREDDIIVVITFYPGRRKSYAI